MTRKSKGKFEMKGHSIPGIKGFKSTALEDGRAASSAFQMQSPVKQDVIEKQLEGEDKVIPPPMDKPIVEDPRIAAARPPEKYDEKDRNQDGIVDSKEQGIWDMMNKKPEPRMNPNKFGGMNPRKMMQMYTRDGGIVYVDDAGKKYNEDGTPYQRR